MQYTVARWRVFLVVISLLGVGLHFLRGYTHPDQSGHAWGSDDAFITYRYAQNLVNGHGLVFNPNEAVEGYSNLLYTLLSAAVLLLVSSNTLYLVMTIFNALFHVLTILIFFDYLRQQVHISIALWISALLSFAPLLWVWAASGLETSLMLLLQLNWFILLEKKLQQSQSPRLAWMIFLIALTILLRVDGFVTVAIVIIILLLHKHYRLAVILLVLSATILGTHLVWRYETYGLWLSNTYYAKVSGTLFQRFNAALLQFLRLTVQDAFLLYPALLLLGLRLPVSWRTASPRIFSVPLWYGAGFLGYWFLIGGDVFRERFLIILIPLGLLELARRVEQRSFSRGWRLACAALLLLQLSPFLTDARFDYRFAKYDRWIELGQFLGKNYPHTTLAIDAAGKTPFFSGLYTIDMLGLNDSYLAQLPATQFVVGHNKFDPDYILNHQPDWIAAWIYPNHDLYWGLTRTKYEAAGYHLRYLVNSQPTAKPVNILNVSGWSDTQLAAAFSEGYQYAVLARGTP